MAGQSRVSGIDIDAHGFNRGLAAAVAKLEISTEHDLLRAAIDVQNRAKELCPVDTGRLRASIDHVPGHDSKGYYVEVGTHVDYAGFVEFGTSRQAAQPFMRPSLAEVAGMFRPRAL